MCAHNYLLHKCTRQHQTHTHKCRNILDLTLVQETFSLCLSQLFNWSPTVVSIALKTEIEKSIIQSSALKQET